MSGPATGEGDIEAIVSAIASTLRTGRRPTLPQGADEIGPLDDLLAQLVDISRFALALSKGDLDQELHQSGLVAGSLKGLQGALRHVSWQAQRVAGGDLSQRVDFMGDFAAAFNTMVDALDDARSTLEAQNTTLEELATTDALTGAWNRRKFNDLVADEFERARRYGQTFALFILDIDHFKRVNDTHGHSVGDEVLREVAEIVRVQMRSVDALARWGGEEFVVLSPGVAAAGCATLAERTRTALETHSFLVAGRVTASFGVAQYESPDTPDTLFSRADEALYAAKEGGRNRVVTGA